MLQDCVAWVLLSFYNVIFHLLLCTLTIPAINTLKQFDASNTKYLVNYITVSVPCVKDLQVLHVEMLGNKSETKNHKHEPIYMQFLDEIYIRFYNEGHQFSY